MVSEKKKEQEQDEEEQSIATRNEVRVTLEAIGGLRGSTRPSNRGTAAVNTAIVTDGQLAVQCMIHMHTKRAAC